MKIIKWIINYRKVRANMNKGAGKYLAYGVGQAGDTIPYCMFYTFFIFFLTDVVGLSPMVAGAISLVAVCWDGIMDPVVGYLSDHTKNTTGRRRPWMIKSMVPLALVVFLLFAPFHFPNTNIAAVYYFVMGAAFWTLYTTYVIPYMGLGAEITKDYNGRIWVRMSNMIFGGLFMLLCTSGPTVVWSWGTEHGLSDQASWGLSGAIFGFIALIFMFISWVATKGMETPQSELQTQSNDFSKENIITTFKETLRIKPYRKICLASVFFFIGTIACSSAQVYLIIYNCGMNDAQQAIFWVVYAVAYTAMVPIGAALSARLEKKKAFLFGMAITACICVGFFIVGIDSFMMANVYIALFQFGSTLYWTTYLAFAYDCVEIDDYVNGKRREGSMSAIVSFAQKLGSAIGTYSVGAMLTLVGYDAAAEEQTAHALTGILGLCTLLPAAACIIAILFMASYPVGKKEYDLIVQAIEDRKEGKDIDESGFEKCL